MLDKYLKKLSERYDKNLFDFYIFKNELSGQKIDNKTRIPVLCKTHNKKFYTTYIHAGYKKIKGCSECIHDEKVNRRITISELIEKWKTKIKDNIDYSLIDLSIQNNWNEKTKITLSCPIHGKFETTIGSRNSGASCLECYRERQRQGCNLSGNRIITTEQWIERFKSIHGDLYDYSLITEIKNNIDKIPIICKEHGIFYQSPNKHYNSKTMCPKCKTKSKGEVQLIKYFNDNNIKFECEKTFNGLRGLGGFPLRYDFYLEKYNLLIEYDGIVHYQDRFNRPDIFLKQQTHDKMKTEYAIDNHYNFIRCSHVHDFIKEFESEYC
jgi:hypothetical protein